MKFNKLMLSAVIASTLIMSVGANAGSSIGRSSPSPSRSSYTAPSRPSYTAPSPSRSYTAPAPTSSGIGGTGSMGVRKSAVTAPVAAQVQSTRPVAPTAASPSTYSNTYHPTPSYSTPVPQYSGPSTGGIFMGALGGSLVGNMLGNSIFGNHNNGGYNSGGGGVAQPGVAYQGGVAGQPGSLVPVPHSYGFGDFIIDAILFTLSIALIACIIFLFYKGFKMIKSYVNTERGVGPTQPFSPTAKFWEIQNAFSTANIATLTPLLGPDLIDEATRDLAPSELTLSGVSHEVKLNNPREFSVHYAFTDMLEKIDQVWHYELHNGSWKLNGIETI